MKRKLNDVTEAIDILFKMRADGRMDEEEAKLLLEVIFSGQMDEFTFNMIKFIYKVRPHGNDWMLEEEDEEGWENIMDFTNMPSGGIPIRELIEMLEELEGE